MDIRKAIRVAACILTAALGCSAGEMRFESVGTRFGFTTSKGSDDFRQAEVFTEVDLPWRWQLSTNWYLLPRLDFSAGWIGDGYKNGFIATAGPDFVLGRERFPLTLVVGSSPTLLSRDEFKATDSDFGIPFQFTTYAGIECKVGRHLSFGCRAQHMSNAGLGTPNPGLNLLMLSLSYRF
jgi:hypothetical protein